MKIAFIHIDFPFGGAEKVTIDVANELLKKPGMEFFVFTKNFHAEKYTQALDDRRFHILSPARGIDDSAFCDFICEYVEEEHIDVAVSVGVNIKHLPERLHQVCCKTVYANHNIPFWEIIVKKMRGKQRGKGNLWKRIEYYSMQYLRYEVLDLLTPKFMKLYRDNLNRYDAFMVLCEEDREIIASKLRFGEDKLVAISNMVTPVDAINYNKAHKFVYVGRLSYADKRIDRLIDAWRIASRTLTGWELIIVGDGPERANLEASAAGMPNVKFAGYRRDTDTFYHDASAICLTSEYEGYPLCLIEAQANGVVPIVMDCQSAGTRSIIAPSGENGFLVPNGDVEAFAQRMIDFAMLPEDEKMRLRHNVVRKSMEYSPERIGNQWLALFDKLSQNKLL